MDDPTRRCENDTGNETRLPGPPIPSGGPRFSIRCEIEKPMAKQRPGQPK